MKKVPDFLRLISQMKYIALFIYETAFVTGLPRGYDIGFVQSPYRKELLRPGTLRATDLFTDIPKHLDWRNDKDGHNMLTKHTNQHIPSYCGACYTMSATSSLSDRINIVSGRTRQTRLSNQVVLNCDKEDNGCHGGDPLSVFQFIHDVGGIPDETCMGFTATGWDTGRTCNDIDICVTCDDKGCRAQDAYPVWSVEEYGLVNGTEAMMAELQRGPIACSIVVTDDFFNLRDFSIFKDTTGDTDLDHSISVVGYGTDEATGTDYWIGRNSWGEYWGEFGFFRIVRGTNNLGIESNCQYAIPANKGQPTIRRIHKLRHVFPVHAEDEPRSSCKRDLNDWEEAGGEKILSPYGLDLLLPGETLPQQYDFRNVSGVQSYWTEDKNQHATGSHCGSCWAEAVTSALSDRLAFQNKGAWPPINLSPQALINCHSGGDCNGGNPAVAYAKIHESGIVDTTCMAYSGQNENKCDDIHVCEECFAGETDATFWPGTCHAVPNQRTWFVSEYGKVSGTDNMKAEIFKRGPITCGLFANQAFVHHEGGHVIEADAPNPWTVNHEVEVAGWGIDKHGEEYWIARNSWGTYWGEMGWFKIRMHRKNLNIETDCSWGVPATNKNQETGLDFETE